MADPTAPQSPAWLAVEWARQLTNVVETMTGESPIVTYAPHELSTELKAEPDEFFWWEQPFSLSAESLAWIGASTKSWEEIGNRVLRSAGVEEEDRETIRGTYLEIVNQALSGVAGALSSRVRREISCLEGKRASPSALDQVASYSFEIGLGESTFPVLAVFSRSLADIPETPVETAKPEPAPLQLASAAAPPQRPTSIELLLDVELPVSVSFGRAQLALKDVIKLTTGSIIELNRNISEPVEVIVNNCVIARGEVVVIEGNFGVRIKQVISRQERLRTLN